MSLTFFFMAGGKLSAKVWIWPRIWLGFIMACAAGCVMATLPLAMLALDSCALTFGIKFYFREVLPRPVGASVKKGGSERGV